MSNTPSVGTSRRPTTSSSRSRARDQVQARTWKHVTLRVHEIACVKTTKEIDRDEIVLASLLATGEIAEKGGRRILRARAEEGARLDAGKFRKGDKKTYPDGKAIARFPFGGVDLDWPRRYVATLVLIEKDEGAIGTVVNAILNKVEGQIKEVAVDAAGIALGAAIGTPVPLVGPAVGALVGAGVSAGIKAIKNSRRDDVFPPEKQDLELARSPAAAGEIDKKVVRFRAFNGDYKVVCSWAVS